MVTLNSYFERSGPGVIKDFFFILNSAEHEFLIVLKLQIS